MSDHKLKVMHVTMRFSGGIFTFLQNMTNGCKDEFDQVIVYAHHPALPSKIRSFFDKSVHLIRLSTYDEDHSIIADKACRDELRALIKQEQPDIVHLHGYHAGRLGRKAFETLRIPILYTPHGYRFLAEDHNRLTRSLFRHTESSLANNNCMTVASSKGEFAETLSFTKNATFINNGIDVKLIDELTEDIKGKKHPLTIFTTGLINPQKNPELFNDIANAMPDTKFVWIGDGESKYKLTAPNIEITGWLEHKEAIKKMCEGDIFLLTSLWEGLPISLLEAMYLKKMCIVSNVVGSRDVINNGENGFICDSAASFVNTIHHYADESTKKIIENGHKDILENYTLEMMINSYKELYKEKTNLG